MTTRRTTRHALLKVHPVIIYALLSALALLIRRRCRGWEGGRERQHYHKITAPSLDSTITKSPRPHTNNPKGFYVCNSTRHRIRDAQYWAYPAYSLHLIIKD
jgi:hypothetical protein